MRMLMFMAAKNIYVSDTDLPLFERAAELAGGMSAAVAAGLRLYVAQREKERKLAQMTEIEVEVQDGPVVTAKRFTGRLLLRYQRRDGLRVTAFRVYVTAKGQYAIYTRNDPDWSRLSSPSEDNSVWEDPSTWETSWWETTERSLHVFPDTASMADEVPAPLIKAITDAQSKPAVEVLDI
jgi:EXLDI family protein